MPLSLSDFPDRPLRRRAGFFHAIVDDENIASANSLICAASDDPGTGDKPRAFGGAQIVYLELQRQHFDAEDGTSRESQGVIREIAEYAAMGEAILLQMLRLQIQRKFRMPFLECQKFRTQQGTERLRGKNLSSDFQHAVT